MLGRKKYWFIIMGTILLFTLLLGSATSALGSTSEGGGGAEASSGTSGSKPLNLVSIQLDDGTDVQNAGNIPLIPQFTLEFDKNVVYMINWENNRSCFHLYENDSEVAINVTKIDDTVDFTKRHYIYVQPIEPLLPGTDYSLYIAPELIAKNGNSTLGGTTDNQGIWIKFTTAGQKPAAAEEPFISKEPGQEDNPVSTEDSSENELGNTETLNTAQNSSVNTIVQAGEPVSDTDAVIEQEEIPEARVGEEKVIEEIPAAEEQQTSSMSREKYLAVLSVVLIAGWVTVEFYLKRKGKKN